MYKLSLKGKGPFFAMHFLCKFSLILLFVASASARFDHHHQIHNYVEVTHTDTTPSSNDDDLSQRKKKVRKMYKESL